MHQSKLVYPTTPRKFNIAPENGGWFRFSLPFLMGDFQVNHVEFRGSISCSYLAPFSKRCVGANLDFSLGFDDSTFLK